MTPPRPENDQPSFAELYERDAAVVPSRRRLSIGDTVEGVVVQVSHDTAIVDIDGKREGYVDLAGLEAADGRQVSADVMSVGAKVKALVVEWDDRSGAVRLQPVTVRTRTEPGQASEERSAELPDGVEETVLHAQGVVTPGARVQGPIVRIESYGVFLQIGEAKGRPQRGLIPLRELGLPHGADPRKHHKLGDILDAQVSAVDDKGRIRLSIRALRADDERAQYVEYEREKVQQHGDGNAAKGFGTLGDLLQKSTAKKRK